MKPRFRRLIACIDGTWNSEREQSKFFSYPSNVERVHQLLVNDGERQRVLYLPGVGTRGYSDRLIGGIWGAGTLARLRSVYRTLCENYNPGDQIALFGFSRGAFAARAIAGLIGTVGILRWDKFDHIKEAFSYYQNPKKLKSSTFQDFRDRYTWAERDVTVLFVGLWDTVIRHGPILLPMRWLIERAVHHRLGLLDASAGGHVQNVAHALALDEKRAAFSVIRITTLPFQRRQHWLVEGRQTVEELWFAGSHSDVGGGCQESRSSEYSLRWIVNRAMRAGLVFKEMPPSCEDAYKAPLNPSRTGIWRFLPSRRRVVLESDRIHESVRLRMCATSYRPMAELPQALLWAPREN
jgi:uncharacterized protein (DUF2235 family)